jgi:hypothetical protein
MLDANAAIAATAKNMSVDAMRRAFEQSSSPDAAGD